MMPFVPVTVSRITAATVFGPSYIRISSRCGPPVQTGHGSGWPAGQRYVNGSSMRTTPGMPGSAGPRGGAPGRVVGAPGRAGGQRDRAAGRAVVRAVARDDLVAARRPARELDRVLVGLGAAVREEAH